MVSLSFSIPTATKKDIRDGIDPSDDGYPPIDGCRMKDVGRMKVKPLELILRKYSLTMGYGWDGCYKRPSGFPLIN